MKITISRREAAASFDIVVRVARAMGKSVDPEASAEAFFEPGKELPRFITVEGDLLTLDIPEHKFCAVASEVGCFYEGIAALVKSAMTIGKVLLNTFSDSGKRMEKAIREIMED